jgi:hypothetical protein
MTEDHRPVDVTSITASFLDIAEAVGPLVDVVAGYRAKLELAGYSPTMAEAMSAQLHGQLLAQMFTSAQ